MPSYRDIANTFTGSSQSPEIYWWSRDGVEKAAKRMVQQLQKVAKVEDPLWRRILQSGSAGYISAALGIAVVTAIFAPFPDRLNHTTVVLALLLVVLFVTILWGSGPGRVAAVLGVLCFNFFFLPPIYTFTIADPQNWVALTAFLIAASAVGHLEAHAAQRAKEAEAAREELRLAGAYNRSLIESSLDPLVTIGPDGKITDVNAATEIITGHSRAELIGTDFSDYFTDPEKARAGYQQVFREGLVRDYALELRHQDGQIRSVLYNASVYRDNRGKVIGVFAAARDITERQRAEEALRESEANLNRAQEIAHIGSWHLDVTHNRLTWSDEVFRMFGIRAGSALTYDAFLEMIHPEDRESVNKAWTAALHGAPYDIEHRIVAGDELKWVRERAKVEFDTEGIAVEGTGTVQDITERKRAEQELLRINRAHSALSHCNQTLVRATDESSLLEQICRIIVDEAGYRFCWVGYAEQEETKAVRPLAHAGLEAGYLQTLNITWADTERGRGPTGTCIRTGEIQIIKDTATDPRMAPWRAEALKRGYASSVAIPILVASKPFGALNIYASETETFGSEEMSLLRELADDLGYGISFLRTRAERIRALEEIRTLNSELEERVSVRTAELRKTNQELEQAREREGEIGFRIQQTLLLDPPPTDIPGLQVAALTLPSQRIGGDFYIFIRHPEECLDVIVGDVMGKGITGALLGAATKSQLLRSLSELLAQAGKDTLPEPREIVMSAHAQLVRHLIELDSFVTLCYARLDARRRSLTLVDCGHTGVLQLHSKTGLCEILHGDNLPLGFREGEIYDQASVPLEPGDCLYFFSDGITEARNALGELFGATRLQESVRLNREFEPDALVRSIHKAVSAFSSPGLQRDDLTSVAVYVEEIRPALSQAELDINSDLKNLPRVREFIRDFCSNLPTGPLEEQRVGALVLAVDEAVCNIIKHAYHGRADQRIHLEAEAFPGRLSIRLHHIGDPVDPAQVPPPSLDGSRDSGFGMYIIARSVDDVRYYRDERGRNCIELTLAWNG